MNQRMLGTVCQPFCGKCCGEHTKSGNKINKRRARRMERRELMNLIDEELYS